MPRAQNRNLALDLLRVLACFLVIVNHTTGDLLLTLAPSGTWYALVGFFFLSKPAVPLFYLVTGTLLLGREEPVTRSLARCARILAVLFLFSLLYYGNGLQGKPFSFSDYWASTWHAPQTRAFWYLYVYAGLMLMVPLLQRLARGMKETEYRYLFAVLLTLLSVLPIASHLTPELWYSAYIDSALMAMPLCVLLLGYYVSQKPIPRARAALLPCILLILLGAFLSVRWTAREYAKWPADYLWFDNINLATILTPAVCWYLLSRMACARVRPDSRAARLVSALGRDTFGVYLLADFAQEKLQPLQTFLLGRMHMIPAVVFFQICIFACCLPVAAVLRRLPGLRKLL